MVTSCPPSSIELMRRPRIATSLSTRVARLSPPVSSACNRAREAAVSAVSAPAKNAAATRLKTIRTAASGHRHKTILAQAAGKAAAGEAIAAARRAEPSRFRRGARFRRAWPSDPWIGRPSNARRTSAAKSCSSWAIARLRLFRLLGGDASRTARCWQEAVVLDRQAPPAHPERADQRGFDQAAERSDQPVAGRVEDFLVEAHVGADQVAVARFSGAPCRHKRR